MNIPNHPCSIKISLNYFFLIIYEVCSVMIWASAQVVTSHEHHHLTWHHSFPMSGVIFPALNPFKLLHVSMAWNHGFSHGFFPQLHSSQGPHQRTRHLLPALGIRGRGLRVAWRNAEKCSPTWWWKNSLSYGKYMKMIEHMEIYDEKSVIYLWTNSDFP